MKKNLNIAYLNGAEGLVRKAAPSGGSGSGDPILYYKIPSDVDKSSMEFDNIACVMCHIKALDVIQNRYEFVPLSYIDTAETPGELLNDTIAFAFLPIDVRYNTDIGGNEDLNLTVSTCEEFIQNIGLDIKLERITAEEYWNKSVQDTMTFLLKYLDLSVHVFECSVGMTWNEWIESEYNTEGLENYGGTYVKFSPTTDVRDVNGANLKWEDVIRPNTYIVNSVPV